MSLYALVLCLHVCVLVCPKITYIQISVTVKSSKRAMSADGDQQDVPRWFSISYFTICRSYVDGG